MARQRIIRPEFFTDERLAACQPHARLLFAGLWGLADKRGRLRDQPPVIHGAVFPFEPDLDIDSLLDDLQYAGSILRYTVDGKNFIQVKNFERYQNPHPKEAESVIPAPPPLYRAEPRKDTAEPLLSTAEPGGIRSFVPSDPETDTDARPSSPQPVENDPERQELLGVCKAIAERLEVEPVSIVARVAAIPAGEGHPAKSFSNPSAKGISIKWVRAALSRARALLVAVEKPVPL